jgi:hypothetical protein
MSETGFYLNGIAHLRPGVKRFVCIEYDGARMVTTPADAEEFMRQAKINGETTEYTVRDRWLTDEEFDSLSEFEGF